MTKLPKIYCISLESAADRRSFVQQQALKYGLDVTIIDAIDGRKLELMPKFSTNLELEDKDARLSQGAIGCALSHFSLWNLISCDVNDECIILEDDAVLCEDFHDRFKVIYEQLPHDWEFVYLGWINYCPKKDLDIISVTPDLCKFASINDKAMRLATHAYMIKKSVVSKMKFAVFPLDNHIDLTLTHRVLEHINYYVVKCSIVDQMSYINYITYGVAGEPRWKSSTGLNAASITDDYDILYGTGWDSGVEKFTDKWKWSNQSFELVVNPVARKLKLQFTMAQNNTLVLRIGDIYQEHALNTGNNEVVIDTCPSNIIKCELKNSFIPADHDSNSYDTRNLGICLKNVEIACDVSDIWKRIDIETILNKNNR